MPKKRQIMPKNTIGGRIDTIIDILDVNSKKFADLINISEGHLSDLRHGKAELSKRVIKGIVRWIIIDGKHINEHWLQTGEGDMFDKNQELIAEKIPEYKLPERLQDLIQKLKDIFYNGNFDEKIKTSNTIDIISEEIKQRKEAIRYDEAKKEVSINEGEDIRDKAG